MSHNFPALLKLICVKILQTYGRLEVKPWTHIVFSSVSRAASYLPKQGTTKVTKKDVRKVEYDIVSTRVIRDLPEPEPMLM